MGGGKNKKGKKKKGGGGGGGGGGNAAAPAPAARAPVVDEDSIEAEMDAAPLTEVAGPVLAEGCVGFAGGDTMILKCPSHKYESTVAFYRDILGLAVEQREGLREALSCAFEWGNGMHLIVVRTDKLTHPSIWLTVDTSDHTEGRSVIEAAGVLRTDVEELPATIPGFFTSPPSDMLHIVKCQTASMATYPGGATVTTGGGGSAKQSNAAQASPAALKASAHDEQEGKVEDVTSTNPLNVEAASHAPQGQRGKSAACTFTGGNNIAIKCPHTKYESTVAFYREVLGLHVLHYCQSCCKIRWRGSMSLWIDCVESLSSPAVWLEVSTADTNTAKAYLKGRKRVTMRPEVFLDLPKPRTRVHTRTRTRTHSQVETLPQGVDGFWISPPNDMVHLIRGEDGQDNVCCALSRCALTTPPALSCVTVNAKQPPHTNVQVALPPGELSQVRFTTAAERFLQKKLNGGSEGDAQADADLDDSAAQC